jgi:cell division septation protein DedD
MPADDPREPRFDTTPAPRLGPADPLRPPPGRQLAAGPEPDETPSRLNLRTVAIGVGIAVLLAAGLVYGLGHHGSSSPTPPTTPPPQTTAPASQTEPAPATSPAPEAAPSAAPGPAPAPTQAPVSPPPPAAAPTAPPATVPAKPTAPPTSVHPAQPPPKTAAVPQEGPKHRRRTAESSGDWLVQAGAYQTRDRAQVATQALIKHGYPAHTVAAHEGWFLVEVTGFKTRADADAAAGKLAANEHVPTLVRQVRRGTATTEH